MRFADFPPGGQGMGAGESAVTQGLLSRCVGSPRARGFDAAGADSPEPPPPGVGASLGRAAGAWPKAWLPTTPP